MRRRSLQPNFLTTERTEKSLQATENCFPSFRNEYYMSYMLYMVNMRALPIPIAIPIPTPIFAPEP